MTDTSSASPTPSESLLQGFTLEQVQAIADENSSFRGFLQGYLAEAKLKEHLLQVPGILSVEKIPDQDETKGDFLVVHTEGSFIVEVKSLASGNIKEDLLEGGLLATVAIKGTDPKLSERGTRTSCLPRGTFDVLAICTFQATGKWEFLFIHNKYLPESMTYPGRLQSSIRLNTETTPCLHRDIRRVLPDLS